jgi:hypothetical protein
VNRLSLSQSFPAVTPAGDYHEHLAELRAFAVSGVYAIADASGGKVWYVGESHTGRLYDTITRHFRRWSIDARRDAQGRRFGGTTYDRRRVRVAFLITAPDEAQAQQYAEIQRLDPRDNEIDGSVTAAELPV